MKRIFPIFLLLAACAREAEIIKVQSETVPLPGISRLIPGDAVVTPEMRTSSIILYPNTFDPDMAGPNDRIDELAGLSYAPDEAAWESVMSQLSFGNKVPKGFSTDDRSDKKGIAVTYTILAISQARDQFYKEAKNLEKDLDKGQAEIDKLNAEVVARYACYSQTISDEGVTTCKKALASETDSPVFAEKCKDLADWKFDFSDEEEAIFDSQVGDCTSKTSKFRTYYRAAKKEKIAPLMSLRKTAKGIVTEMLKQFEVAKGERYIFTASTTEDNEDEEIKSSIQFAPGNRDILNFNLYMDAGSGFKMYDLTNGGIKNLKFYDRAFGVRALEFTVIGDDFSMEASLAEDVQEPFGLRFVGDIKYVQGAINRKGVMKLEWDLNFPPR